jgi:hypothetical protein
MPALTGLEKSAFHPWLKIQTPFAPFVQPKLILVAAVTPTAEEIAGPAA